MLRDERPSLDGKHYRVKNAINQPPPVSRIPVMIGGSGEKKTLRMVAQYADESNMTSQFVELPRTCSLPGHGHLPGRVEQLGRTASKVLGL